VGTNGSPSDWLDAQAGALLGGIAHDLSNPLSSIIGYAELLAAQPDLAEQVRADVRAILEDAERLATLLRSVQRLARVQRGADVLVDLEEVARDALALSGYALRHAGVEVSVSVAPDLPRVRGNGHRLLHAVLQALAHLQPRLAQAAPPRRLAVSLGALDGGPVLELAPGGADPAGPVDSPAWRNAAVITAEHAGRLTLETGADGQAVVRFVFPAP